MVKQFIDGYNALQDKMDALGKRNSIVELGLDKMMVDPTPVMPDTANH